MILISPQSSFKFACSLQAQSFALVVVDEAHHLHADGELEPIVNRYALTDKTKLVLLSDVSQSGAIDMMRNIFHTDDIRLEEVSLAYGNF